MMRTLKTALAAAAVVAVSTVAAGAATLSIIGGAPLTLPTSFDPNVPDLAPGGAFTNFLDPFSGQGLYLDGPATLKFTFLGKEAAFTNSAVELAGGKVLTDGVVGASISFQQLTAGFVNFKFTSAQTGSSITNGVGGTNSTLDMGFAKLAQDGLSVFAIYGDGGSNNDRDYDDFVMKIEVSAVPLPAGGLLLLTALGGIAALRRRKAA